MEALNQGRVTEEELEATKRGLINSFLTMEDNPTATIDRGMLEAVHGVRWTPQEVVDLVRRVTVEDLVEQGRKLKLDTIYFLRGEMEKSASGNRAGQEVQLQ